MTHEDIPFGVYLSRQAGWNQTAADWHRFLALEPAGCFVAEWDGQPAGTTALCVFGSIAWIAMVLVEESLRRRGIGTALLEHALAWLEARGVATARLDATPLGQPIYQRLGFVPEYEVGRWEGIATASERVLGIRPIAPGDIPAIVALDAQATGTPRHRLLEYLLERHPSEGYTFGQPPAGYATGRPGAKAWHIGPIVAQAAEIGMALADARLAQHPGQPVFIDIPLDHAAACAWASSRGFRLQRRWTRMVRGPLVNEVHLWLWASSGPEAG